MHDVFFISYDEPNAEDNWRKLRSRFPVAKRVHGIKGIKNAHMACAKKSLTRMFWTIDGDTVVDDNWDPRYTPPVWDQQYLHVWFSRNPINGLTYGYGAIKLWPKNVVLEHNRSWIDFTSSVGGIKIVENVISTTAFNTSPYNTWKSAFRECVKLSENVKKDPNDVESQYRLSQWLTVSNDSEPYASWCIIGANDGVKWFQENFDNIHFINDFDWLHELFVTIYPTVEK
jgi:hypothetical protein